MKIDELVKETPTLKNLKLGEGDLYHDKSWFSILWTCQRVSYIEKDLEDSFASCDTQESAAAIANVALT